MLLPSKRAVECSVESHPNGEWKSMLNEPLSCYGVKVNRRVFVCAFLQKRVLLCLFQGRLTVQFVEEDLSGSTIWNGTC